MSQKHLFVGLVGRLARDYIATHEKLKPGTITAPDEIMAFAKWLDTFIRGDLEKEAE